MGRKPKEKNISDLLKPVDGVDPNPYQVWRRKATEYARRLADNESVITSQANRIKILEHNENLRDVQNLGFQNKIKEIEATSIDIKEYDAKIGELEKENNDAKIINHSLEHAVKTASETIRIGSAVNQTLNDVIERMTKIMVGIK